VGRPAKRATYAELIGGKTFDLKITGKAKPKAPSEYKIVGHSVNRWDIPEKVFGTFTYMQGREGRETCCMAASCRPPTHGSSVMAIDESSVAQYSGPGKNRARPRSRGCGLRGARNRRFPPRKR